MQYKQDLTGMRFGRLTVVARHRGKYWRCSCDCGAERIVPSDCLKGGHTSSCGCLRSEMVAAKNSKHGGCKRGQRRDPEYVVWQNMKRRCLDPNNAAYNNYGGRGIVVHDSWVNDYAAFISDMGKRPSPKHTLERIENDGPYSPDNCRWATRLEQRHNQRQRKNALLINGVPLKEMAASLGVPYHTAVWRFKKHGKINL